MRKTSILTRCAIFCLLTAVPENQGVKLLKSLSCVRPYPLKELTCTWLLNNFSEKLLNMNLIDIENHQNICRNLHVARSSLTHSTWTCGISWEPNWTSTHDLKYSFVPNRDLETRPTVIEERDEAKPQNLHCNDTDRNIICSWQVREEIAESIDFGLFYGNDQKECEPRCQQETLGYIPCHCNITIDGHLNTSDLLKTIIVKPRESYKTFRLCYIYQLPPRNLTIEEITKGEVFFATWENTVQEDINFKYDYELCYWNQDDLTLNEDPDICKGKTLNTSHNQDRSHVFKTEYELKPSSNYSLMVRARVRDDNKAHCYQGPWSKWSEVQTLTTKAVPNLIWLYILIPICVIVVVMLSFCGYRALLRYRKQWEESIPNPNKSSIIKSLKKTMNGSSLPYEGHLYVEPYNNIMMSESSVSKGSPYFYHNEQHISKLDSEEDTESLNSCDRTSEDYPTASIADGYKPFTDATDEQESQDIKDSQIIAFDGPYLFS